MDTECACLCVPAGHDHLICGHTARPGTFIRLAGGSEFPACLPCYEARRTQESRPAQLTAVVRAAGRPVADGVA
jgi:hypothetical protein